MLLPFGIPDNNLALGYPSRASYKPIRCCIEQQHDPQGLQIHSHQLCPGRKFLRVLGQCTARQERKQDRQIGPPVRGSHVLLGLLQRLVGRQASIHRVVQVDVQQTYVGRVVGQDEAPRRKQHEYRQNCLQKYPDESPIPGAGGLARQIRFTTKHQIHQDVRRQPGHNSQRHHQVAPEPAEMHAYVYRQLDQPVPDKPARQPDADEPRPAPPPQEPRAAQQIYRAGNPPRCHGQIVASSVIRVCVLTAGAQ
ncbi:Uncharacterised protein [Mycobacteroides abscessus]|nr:Uncharacterised protein [Mycobacteroides abscessus]SHT63213.1 Uncharacterised protein [Mycobacteroides abscessus subsp. abscessus]